jgi:hypothetical protein
LELSVRYHTLPATFARFSFYLRTANTTSTFTTVAGIPAMHALKTAFRVTGKRNAKKFDTPPEPSQPTGSTTTSKSEDLLALRTIIAMLSLIDSPTGRLPNDVAPMGTTGKDRKELRVLDALSAVFIRQHEITAVMVLPYDGSNLQVFGSVVHPSNTESSLLPVPGSSNADNVPRDLVAAAKHEGVASEPLLALYLEKFW